MVPPIISTMFLVMAMPRPVPWIWLTVELRSRSKGSKIFFANSGLMPVCALFSCIVVGWFITPRRAVAEIEAGGTPMAGWLKKVYAIMIRFVTPALILIVEIGGLQSEIAAGNVAVIVFAYALVALCVVAYFLFFRNRDTGTNADEKLSGDYPV